jgi:transcription termination/antitermination protein NusA
VRGVGQRTLAMLEDAGYSSAQQIAREDPDRLAIKTGLGNKKARQIQQGAQHFLANEAKELELAKAQLEAGGSV